MGRGRADGSMRATVAAGYLTVALLLGGGGRPYPLAELAVQCAFALALAAWFLAPGSSLRRVPRAAWASAALCLAVPLLHLVPLPPMTWTALPQRGLMVEALAMIGQEPGWRPLTIDRAATVGALLSLIPAVGLFAMTTTLAPAQLWRMMRIVGIAALVCAGAGAILLAGGKTLYPKAHPGWLTGMFANRNAAADLLLAGMLAWAGLAVAEPRGKVFAYCALAVCGAGVLATGSRAGIVLLAMVVVAFIAHRARGGRGWRAAGGAATVAGFAAMFTPLGTRIGLRFSDLGDARPDLWQDSWTAAQAFWPSGAGLGAFVPAFLLHERESMIDASHPNRAHNDYLEFLVEAGVLAPLVLATLTVLLLHAWRGARKGCDQALLTAASVMMGVMLTHSIVDYPIRTMALSAVLGFAAGCIHALAAQQRSHDAAQGSGR